MQYACNERTVLGARRRRKCEFFYPLTLLPSILFDGVSVEWSHSFPFSFTLASDYFHGLSLEESFHSCMRKMSGTSSSVPSLLPSSQTPPFLSVLFLHSVSHSFITSNQFTHLLFSRIRRVSQFTRWWYSSRRWRWPTELARH